MPMTVFERRSEGSVQEGKEEDEQVLESGREGSGWMGMGRREA